MAIDTETMQLIERVVARAVANATSLKGAADEIAKGVTQYVGARYVPLFADPLEWDNTKAYEPLTIVLHQGNSYTSRQYVPVGVEIDNDSFWALTGNYNAQVEQYRQEVKSLDGRITANENAIETETTNRTEAVTAEKTRAEGAEQTLQTNIDAEKTRAEGAENNISNKLDLVYDGFNEEFHVGSKQVFKTITDAVNACYEAGGGTIIIHSGIYNESITIPSNKSTIPIAFIGTSRDTVIWKYEIYGYEHPCFSGTGNFTFSNITFIKGTPNSHTNSTTVNDGGYALHFDTPNAEGNVKVNNCTAISYENCAIGCGTRINQGIYISNTHIKSVTDKSYSTYGCFIYHTALDRTDQVNQMISLINNTFEYIGNNSVPFTIWNNRSNNIDIHPVFINNAFVFNPIYKKYYDYSGTFINTSPGKLILDTDKCFGNSIGYFNSDGNSQAVNHNGLAITYVDGGIKPKAALITSNDAKLMPANSTFGGFMESDLVEGYDASLVLDVVSGDTYTKAGNANAKWKNIKDLSPIIKVTDLLNPEISNGFISYAKNIAPTNEDYAGIVISPSLEGYRFYFAFKLLTGDLYKNTIIGNTPSGWTKINVS